jgi:tRNA(adenine34) deaminase
MARSVRRRLFLFRLAGAGALSALGARRVLAQAPDADGKRFMARAIAMRELAVRNGDQAYGAVIVKDGRIVAEAPSRVVTKNDLTAHAEREALREAVRALGAAAVRGTTIYSSSRPCSMCQAALHAAGVARMIHGEALTDAGAPQAR